MRKRRRKVFWFPNPGTNGPGADVDDDDYGLFLQLALAAGQSTSSTVITDLTFDRPIEEENADPALRLQSVVGGEYVLRRIVGNVFGSARLVTDGAATSGNCIMLTCGFFVARAEDSTSEAAGASQPIGAETAAELRENYSPGSLSTVREPWIWRKRWFLGQPGSIPTNSNASLFATSVLGTIAHPPTTTAYPSKHTDGSIDARTIRRVSNDNRLWFVASARNINDTNWLDTEAGPFVPTRQGAGANVAVHLDYRLLGHMTRTRSSGTF